MVVRALAIACAVVLGALVVVPSASAAGLSVRAPDVSVKAVGSFAGVRVTVRNTTDRTIRSVRLRVRPGAGVAVSPTAPPVISALRARGVKRVAVKVKAGTSLDGPVRVHLSVTGRGGRSGAGSFRVRQAASGGPAPAAPLVGRTFWNRYQVYDPQTGYSTYNERLFFLSERFAVRDTPFPGDPEPSCTATTVTVAYGSGCLAYTFEAASGRLTLTGDPAGTITGTANGDIVTLAPYGVAGETTYTER